MADPDYIAQTGDVDTTSPEACRTWFQSRARDAKTSGMNAIRYSISDDHKLLLVEAWKDKFAEMGEPQWQLAARR